MKKQLRFLVFILGICACSISSAAGINCHKVDRSARLIEEVNNEIHKVLANGTVVPENQKGLRDVSIMFEVRRFENGKNIIKKCSGTIISRKNIATNAHCIKTNTFEANVTASESEIFPILNGKELAVSGFTIHPDYIYETFLDPSTGEELTSAYGDDIAILHLKDDLPINIIPAALPNQNETIDLTKTYDAVAWGKAHEGQVESSHEMRTASTKVKLIDDPSLVSINNLICSGDSGGSLLENRGHQFTLKAILSRGGKKCSSEKGFALNVAKYVDWIHQEAPLTANRIANTSGGREINL